MAAADDQPDQLGFVETVQPPRRSFRSQAVCLCVGAQISESYARTEVRLPAGIAQRQYRGVHQHHDVAGARETAAVVQSSPRRALQQVHSGVSTTALRSTHHTETAAQPRQCSRIAAASSGSGRRSNGAGCRASRASQAGSANARTSVNSGKPDHAR